MTKFLNNINLEAENDIQFKTATGTNAGKISQTGDDLVISNAVGDILLGNGSDDIYIGDGTNTVDIRFEQDMAIFADSSSTRTLTLGGANTNLVLDSPSISGSIILPTTTINGKMTFGTAAGYILFDYEPTTASGEYSSEVPLLRVDRSGSELTILSRVSNNGAVILGNDDGVAILAGDVKSVIKDNLNFAGEEVVFAAEAGFSAYGFPNNDTSWSNRNQFRFRSDSGTASENGLYIGDGGSTQFIDLSRNLTVADATISGNTTFKPKHYTASNDLNSDVRTIFSTHDTDGSTSNKPVNWSSIYTLGGSSRNTLQISTNEDYSESGMWIRQYNANSGSPQGTGYQNWTEVWTTNKLTETNKTNYDTAYTHSQAAHAPSNAEQNVQSDWNATSGDALILNKPSIPSISGLATTSYVDTAESDAISAAATAAAAKFTSTDGTTTGGTDYTFKIDDESNFSGNKWYHIATIPNTNGGLHIRGFMSNHVETFASQKFDLAIACREGGSGADIEITGQLDVLHNATSGSDRAGIRVIKTADSSYDEYKVYIRTTRYSMVTLRLTQEGSVTFNTSHSSPLTSEPAGLGVELDTSTTVEGNYVVDNSTIKEIYHEGHLPTLTELGAQAAGTYSTATGVANNADVTPGWVPSVDPNYLTSQTSHADVLVDGDFTSNGLMKRTSAGTYTIDSNTYLTAVPSTYALKTYVDQAEADAISTAATAAESYADGLASNYATAAQGSTADSALQSVPSTYALKTYVDTAVANLVDNAPENLNTLAELAEALNDDDDAVVTINTSLGNRYTKTESDARYLQSLPSHNHDDRYYTETESDARYLQSLPSHNHDDRYYTETEVDAFAVKLTGNQTISDNKTFSDDVTITNQLTVDGATDLNGLITISTSTGAAGMRLYNETNTAQIADSYSGNTSKSYIYFDTVSGSNDPGYIMHESSTSEANEGVLHLVPSDDNSTGDYVSIHGTNDADVLKLHTSGLIETANLQLNLKSGSGDVLVSDDIDINGNADVSGTLTSGAHTINSATDSILQLNQTGTDNGWSYINFNTSGTRNYFIGQDASKNFDIYNDNVDATAIGISYANNNVTFGGNIVMGSGKTVDGVDISARDAVLTSTTTTANSALQSVPSTYALKTYVDTAESDAISTAGTNAASANKAWSTITSTPTTISGYGITDALEIGVTATTAMAGNTSIPAAEQYTQHESITQATSNVSNSGRTYLQSITLDSNGHVTGVATASETVVNTNTQNDATTTRGFFSGSGINTTTGVITNTQYYKATSEVLGLVKIGEGISIDAGGTISVTLHGNATSGDAGLMSASDKTKIDTIATNADVTNTTNVTSAGALMDSEVSVTNIKNIDQALESGAEPEFGTANMEDSTNKRFMTDAQETKLDSVATGATANVGDVTLSGTQTISGNKTFSGNTSASGAISQSNTTQSTNKSSGAFKTLGGVGIAKTLNVGEDVVAYASSDKRYKDNLQAITNPIDKVKSLTGYTFTWNDKHEQFNGNDDIGVVAQEVEKVFPEIVDTRDNGYKAVKYEKMVAVLIEAIKDQQKQIDELKEKCNGCSK